VENTTCSACGLALDFVDSDRSVADRKPCPRCGARSRSFAIHPEPARIAITGGVAELSVTRRAIGIAGELRASLGSLSARGTATVGFVAGTPQPVMEPAALPDVLIGAELIRLADKTKDGQLVVGVAVPWIEILRHLETDPSFLYAVPWRKLEELIAGAFERAGWPEVVLTPTSGDKGRDVIATRPGVGSVRIVGQVKAYAQGRVVTAEEVSAIAFTRELDHASKAMLMTTGKFAPGILKDERLKPYVPYQLELLDGETLLRWLRSLRT